jgi:predicted DNA-binding transcriptional regulator AlpA
MADMQTMTGLSQRTISRYVAAGRLPRPLKFSRRKLLWRAADVERYLWQTTSQ